jgi:hypothetical protein
MGGHAAGLRNNEFGNLEKGLNFATVLTTSLIKKG